MLNIPNKFKVRVVTTRALQFEFPIDSMQEAVLKHGKEGDELAALLEMAKCDFGTAADVEAQKAN